MPTGMVGGTCERLRSVFHSTLDRPAPHTAFGCLWLQIYMPGILPDVLSGGVTWLAFSRKGHADAERLAR